jgi:hypothetical protein
MADMVTRIKLGIALVHGVGINWHVLAGMCFQPHDVRTA